MSFNVDRYRQIALKILDPIRSADDKTSARRDFLFSATRSNAGRELPEYFLIYFLLNDLLGFRNLGRFEKIAWSFPIDYKGKAFLIDFRKFGVGVFIQDAEQDEPLAQEIVKKIKGAVKCARPFYNYIAEEAVKKSELSIVNNTQNLYKRFKYLLSLYKIERAEYVRNENKYETKKIVSSFGTMTSHRNLGYQFYQNANWLAVSCIDAFFSWTEHLFIHLAVVAKNVSNGETISNLIDAEWKTKYKAVITDKSNEANRYYDELLIVRQQLRNFMTHGAFGKNGNAFLFHSGTGTVPVLMRHNIQINRFSLNGSLAFNDEDVIKLIEDFIKFLWKGALKPAMYHTQKCELPTILPYAANGKYETAMSDMESMKKFAFYMMRLIDDSSNMDW